MLAGMHLARLAPLLLSFALSAPSTYGGAPVVQEDGATPADGRAAAEIAGAQVDAGAALDRAQTALNEGDSAAARFEVHGAMEILAPLPIGEGEEETARLLWNTGVLSYLAADFPIARQALARVVECYGSTLPPDHPDLTRAREMLAGALVELDDFEGARPLQEAVLEVRERTLPAESPELLDARGNLALTMRNLGDFAGARALQESVLEARERTLPEDHPDLLAARSNLALTLGDLGDLEGARALEESVLEARERALPEDDPDLLQARGNLAATLEKLGDLEGARALEEAVLEARERTLPEDHPDLLLARQNLAGTMMRMGDPWRARELLESVSSAYARTQSPESPYLLSIQSNLAAARYEAGDLDGARALQESILEVCERTLSPDHPTLLNARLNLSLTLQTMGDLEGVRELQESVLEARERTLPEGHPDFLLARQFLAGTMGQLGDFRGARSLLERVLEAREAALPQDHPDVLRARLDLAKAMHGMGDLRAARELEQAVVDACERTLPDENPLALAARDSLATTLCELGEPRQARDLEETVLRVEERTLPPEHPFLLETRTNLAATLYELDELSEARALLEQVLVVRRRTLPEDHPDRLFTLESMAAMDFDAGDESGSREHALELARGMLRRLELAFVLSPREARAVAEAENRRLPTVCFLTDSDDPGAARLRFELGETLRSVASAHHVAPDGNDPGEVELARTRRRLNDLVSGGPTEGQSSQDFTAEVERLTFQRDRLERELLAERSGRGVVTKSVRAEDLARALPAGSAAVGFRRRERRISDPATSGMRFAGEAIAVHVLLSDESIAELELGEAEELAELAREWRSALGEPIERGAAIDDGASDRERTAGARLRARILDPILERLPEETTTLHVCLDDFLYTVPIGALPLDGPATGARRPSDGLRVRDRYEIVNEVSFSRLLAESGPPTTEPSLLAMGGAAFDAKEEGAASAEASAPLSSEPGASRARPATFAPLLQTRFESESVSALFEEAFGEDAPAVLLTKDRATKAAFLDLTPGKRFLHVATHGWFAPDSIPSTLDVAPDRDALWSPMGANETVRGLAPMTLCGLAFAGANSGRDSLGRVPGILTAEELSGIDLSACELAVLSACETNVGIRRAGQGVQSLQAALHAAGVRTAITSLWKVDDAQTRLLMERFYTYLWEQELPKADALWKAKCDLRAEGAPVRDWAAWVLSGDSR